MAMRNHRRGGFFRPSGARGILPEFRTHGLRYGLRSFAGYAGLDAQWSMRKGRGGGIGVGPSGVRPRGSEQGNNQIALANCGAKKGNDLLDSPRVLSKCHGHPSHACSGGLRPPFGGGDTAATARRPQGRRYVRSGTG
jgi:hypothetical protein